MKIGGNDVTRLYVGGAEVNRVYVGAQMVYGTLAAAYEQIVFVGASLIQQTFGQSLTTPNATRTAAFRAAGIAVDVYGYGFGGARIANIMIPLADALAAFPTNTLFVVDIGGNNVTDTRTYASTTLAERNSIITSYDAMIASIGARKPDVLLCPVTFRTYEDAYNVASLPNPRHAVFANEALGALPYNQNIFNPAIAAYRPETMNTDGNPIVDLYNATRNLYEDYVSDDGVHPADPGGRIIFADIFIDRLAYFVNGGAVPAPIVPRAVTAPAVTTAATISGTTGPTGLLMVSIGAASGQPAPVSAIQWRIDGVNIAATGTTVNKETFGRGIYSAVVTWINGVSPNATSFSNTIDVAVADEAPAVTTAATISGTTADTGLLTVSVGAATGSPTPTAAIQWRKDGNNIVATGTTVDKATFGTGAYSAVVTWSNGIAPEATSTSNNITVAAGAFNPTTLFAGNVGWLFDAADLSSMFQDEAQTVPVTAAGQPVRVQRDLSGNGLHRTAASDAARPTLQIDENGRYYLLTDGTDDCMSTAVHVWGTDQQTTCLGLSRLSATASRILLTRGPLLSSTGTGGWEISTRVLSGRETFQIINKGTVSRAVDLTGTHAAPGKFALFYNTDLSDALTSASIDGVDVGSTTASPGGTSYGEHEMFFFARNNATGFVILREYTSIGINRLLTTEERDNLEAWTQARFSAAPSEPPPKDITFTPASVDESAPLGTTNGSFA